MAFLYGEVKFRRSEANRKHPLASEFINQLREKIPRLKEVSEEEEDVLLEFCPNGTTPNLSETKPSVLVVLHDKNPEGTVLDSSRSAQGKNTLIVDYWSQEGIKVQRPDLDTVSEWIKCQQVSPPAEQPAVQPGEVRFLRCVSGNTLGSDEGFIRKLKEGIPGLREESNVENCDVILAFCPVVSRAGTDIQSALQKLQNLSETIATESKPVVLVVLHHTFDQEIVVPDSSRSVDRVNTLTVDCLFHEDRGLLQCYRNQEALEKVTQWIKPPEKSQSPSQWRNVVGTFWNKMPGITYESTGPDPQQEKGNSELRTAEDLKAENDKLTNKLQKNKELFKQIQETLLSIRNNTNPKQLEDEQHDNLMKHLREIDQELKGTSEEEKNTEKKPPTNKDTLSSTAPPNTSEDPPSVNDSIDGFCVVLRDDKESRNTEEINLTALSDRRL